MIVTMHESWLTCQLLLKFGTHISLKEVVSISGFLGKECSNYFIVCQNIVFQPVHTDDLYNARVLAYMPHVEICGTYLSEGGVVYKWLFGEGGTDQRTGPARIRRPASGPEPICRAPKCENNKNML